MKKHLKEEWKWMLIEDAISERYKISNYGRVKDISSGVFVSPVITGIPQYWYVNLTLPCGKRTGKRVHRLLAQVFIDNPNNLEMVDHEDRNKHNNCIDNLRWVTRSQNQMNRDCTLMFKGVPLKHYCEANFDQPVGAYTYLQRCLQFDGCNEDTSLKRYNNYLLHGITGNTKIMVDDVEVILPVFLSSIGISIEEYRKRNYLGLTNEEIQEGYKYLPPTKGKNTRSPCQLEGRPNEVSHYFPSKVSLANAIGVCTGTVDNRTESGCITFSDYKNYINPEQLHIYKGFTGALRQLAERYGLRYEMVVDRFSNKKWTLEDSLETKRLKVRHYIYNGDRITKRRVFEILLPDTPPKILNTRHSKMKCTLEEFLESKGIDLSKITLEPCI